MSLPAARLAPASTASGSLARAADLLGGSSLLKRQVSTRVDAHEIVERGIPSRAFNFLVSRVKVLEAGDVQKAVGVSVRTVQRRSRTPSKPLTLGQSSRAWQFAETLARATEVLGSQDAAERWLVEPAVGLDQRRPLDLLSTPMGAELVLQLLGRVEHGVYS